MPQGLLQGFARTFNPVAAFGARRKNLQIQQDEETAENKAIALKTYRENNIKQQRTSALFSNTLKSIQSETDPTRRRDMFIRSSANPGFNDAPEYSGLLRLMGSPETEMPEEDLKGLNLAVQGMANAKTSEEEIMHYNKAISYVSGPAYDEVTAGLKYQFEKKNNMLNERTISEYQTSQKKKMRGEQDQALEEAIKTAQQIKSGGGNPQGTYRSIANVYDNRGQKDQAKFYYDLASKGAGLKPTFEEETQLKVGREKAISKAKATGTRLGAEKFTKEMAQELEAATGNSWKSFVGKSMSSVIGLSKALRGKGRESENIREIIAKAIVAKNPQIQYHELKKQIDDMISKGGKGKPSSTDPLGLF